MATEANYTKLSKREYEVLQAAANGESSKRIGYRLGLSKETVDGYAKIARQKLFAASRCHAVAIAIRKGLIT